MTRLFIQGVWIDLNDFTFEMKWKHPISTSLIGENSNYSTDIIVPLTSNNRRAFDYNVFGNSSKTNKYIYGTFYANGASYPVRCTIKSFQNNTITFVMEQFLNAGVANMLAYETNICDLYKSKIYNLEILDRFMDIHTGDLIDSNPTNYTIPLTPNIFSAIATDTIPTRYYIRTDNTILNVLADFYGITLVNVPTNYILFPNKWKLQNGLIQRCVNVPAGGRIKLNTTTYTYNDNFKVDASGKIVSTVKFRFFVDFYDMYLDSVLNAAWADAGVFYTTRIYLVNATGDKFLLYTTSLSTTILEDDVHNINDIILDAGEYHIYVEATHHLSLLSEAFVLVNFAANLVIHEDLDNSGSTDFGDDGYYPCWQNMPAITVKKFFETIALCAGMMVTYTENSVIFKNFDEVFDYHNAIDVSSKLISWKEKTFSYLSQRTNTVVYGDGKLVASVRVNDETLPDTSAVVATIDAVRVEDDTAEKRNIENLLIQETTDGHFDIIYKLKDIYAPLVNTRMFEADFLYFKDNRKPLLIRQLGGIFIALESIATTKNTITLKLLKIR